MRLETKQARQGDVLFTAVTALPEGCKPRKPKNGKHVIVSSADGHDHVCNADEADFFETDDMMTFYLVRKAEALRVFHEKPGGHDPFGLVESEVWMARRAREGAPEGWRPVAD